MRFLIDAQLPPGLVGWLAEKGHLATHVNDIFLTAAEDPDIWNHALEDQSIIVTKDEDFSQRLSKTAGTGTPLSLLGNAL